MALPDFSASDEKFSNLQANLCKFEGVVRETFRRVEELDTNLVQHVGQNFEQLKTEAKTLRSELDLFVSLTPQVRPPEHMMVASPPAAATAWTSPL